MKEKIPLKFATRLINSGPVALISVKGEKKDNIMTIAWHMPLSHNPPLIACAVGRSNYTFELLEKAQEFVLNIPPAKYIDEAVRCGTESGRDVDKFRDAHFTKVPAREIDAPVINECVGHLEIKIVRLEKKEDHTLIVGEIKAAYVNKGLFVNYRWDLTRVNLFHHLGGNMFLATNGKIIYK